jgi:outer membrane lipoprotein-sorting protein
MKTPPIFTACAAAVLGTALLIAAPLVAQPQDAVPQETAEPKQEPRDVLERARENLIGLKSVRATILETVSIGDRRFRATGSYLQGTDMRLRLEYTVKAGSAEGSLLEVCDGTILWSRQTIGDQTRLTRRDVRQILNAAASGGNVAENILIAELGLGGLPALLASLERSMTFDEIERQEIDAISFVIIGGTWNSEFRQRFQASPASPGSDQLPDLVPDRVRIYFDAETLFPRRIQYLKAPTDTELEHPLVALDFTDVELDAPVSASEFQFEPPDNVYAEDVTNKYIEKLNPAAASSAPAPGPAK